MNDLEWSKQFIPAVLKIIGPYTLTEAPLQRDLKEATDLVLVNDNLSVGMRIRSAEPGRDGRRYDERYPWDFTIRSHTRFNKPTEIDKVIAGYMTWFFYGHQLELGSDQVGRWFLLDMDVFRRERPVGDPFPNGDGTGGLAYKVTKLAPDLVIGSSHEIPYPVDQLQLI